MSRAAFLVSVLLLVWLGRSARARPGFRWVARVGLNGVGLFLSAFSLPLGPEDRVVRRQPWVTYGVAGLCLVVFALQALLAPGPGWRGEVERARDEAAAYALERPYLAVPRPLASLGPRELGARRSGGAAERPDWRTVGLEQAELERKSEALVALLRQRPEWRWGDVAACSTWRSQLGSAFVHGGWGHLLGNMAFLLAFAPFLEDVYGRLLFALFYLGATFASGLSNNAALHGHYVVSCGASGAVSGVMGAFLVRFARRRLALLSLPSLWLPVLRVRLAIPAYAFLLLFFAGNVHAASSGVPGIAWWAHIGGFLFGVLFAGLVRLTRVEERLVNPRIEARVSLQQHPAVLKSFALRANGRFESALRAVEAALAEQPRNVAVLREAYDAAVAAGALDPAGTHATRVVSLLAGRSDADHLRETRLFVEEVQASLGARVPARFFFAAGDCLERQGQVIQALRLYEGLLSHPEPAVARRAVAREARLRASLCSRAELSARAVDVKVPVPRSVRFHRVAG